MAYNKTVWDEQTAITPSRLNKMEDGIERNSDDIEDINNEIDDIKDYQNENSPDAIRNKSTSLKVELRTSDLDPYNSENQGRIYLRTDL